VGAGQLVPVAAGRRLRGVERAADRRHERAAVLGADIALTADAALVCDYYDSGDDGYIVPFSRDDAARSRSPRRATGRRSSRAG
jgi:hypothetical protein